MEHPIVYTRSELAEEVGVTTEYVRQLTQQGLIVPTVKTVRGRDLFSEAEVVRVKAWLSERRSRLDK